MELEHEFTVPVDVSTAWEVLLDVERIAPCLPGATIESAGGGSGTGGEDAGGGSGTGGEAETDTFTGRVKVRVGPITVAYVGTASFTEKDESARRAVLQARGRETRGAGTAAATVTATLHEAGYDTRVAVHTNLAITGRPAQFGRGVMDDVGAKLLGQFADCLAAELTSATSAPTQGRLASETSGELDAEPAESPEAAAPVDAGRPTPDSINLVSVAGGSVMRRIVLPVLLIVALIVILIVLL